MLLLLLLLLLSQGWTNMIDVQIVKISQTEITGSETDKSVARRGGHFTGEDRTTVDTAMGYISLTSKIRHLFKKQHHFIQR